MELLRSLSISSRLCLVGLSVDVERWPRRDSFRGLLFAGILDMRRGIAGDTFVAGLLEARYVGI